MQLTLNIENESVAKKILWLLEHFKKDGISITQDSFTETKKNVNDYSDKYLEENWKDIVMSVGNNDKYYKSEEYVKDRGNYLAEKYS